MPRSSLALALLCHLALAFAYAHSTPAFEGPDESDHFLYAQHLGNAGELPLAPGLVVAQNRPQTDGAMLAHHPPAYYALLGAAMAMTGTDDTVFSLRLNPAFAAADQPSRHLKYQHGNGQGEGVLRWLRCLSALLGVVTLVCVHRLGRAVCPAQPRIADLAALLVACLPMHSFLHGVLNNDVLATAVSAATVLTLVRVMQAETLRLGHGLRLGVLLGLALLTKLTTLFLLPLAALVFAVRFVQDHRNGTATAGVRAGLTALGLAAAIAGWWFLRNHQLYGDPLALAAHDASFTTIPPEQRLAWLLGTFLPVVFASLFGVFGWFSLAPHPLLVAVGAAVAGLALVGLLLALRTPERRRDDACAPRQLWLLLAVLLLVFAGTARFNWTAPQPQARLLFPAIAPAAVLLAAGLVRLAPRTRWRAWLQALPIGVAVLVFVAWFRPAFDRTLAEAPPEHRTLVSGIAHSDVAPTIEWLPPLPPAQSDTPPQLQWRENGAPADAGYTLYAYDQRGRVWLATFEWTVGGMVLRDGVATVPEAALGMLREGEPMWLVLRRVPRTADEDPATLPRTPPLPFRWR